MPWTLIIILFLVFTAIGSGAGIFLLYPFVWLAEQTSPKPEKPKDWPYPRQD